MNSRHCLINKYGLILVFVLILLWPLSSLAGSLCFTEAGRLYNIDPLLLRAIGIFESNLKTDIIGTNRNAQGKSVSKDFGIMQINEIHVPELIVRGVIKNQRDLLLDPCLNIKIGAEILYKHFERCGVNWHCLGTYNAGFSKNNHSRRLDYARKIHVIYIQLKRKGNFRSPHGYASNY